MRRTTKKVRERKGRELNSHQLPSILMLDNESVALRSSMRDEAGLEASKTDGSVKVQKDSLAGGTEEGERNRRRERVSDERSTHAYVEEGTTHGSV